MARLLAERKSDIFLLALTMILTVCRRSCGRHRDRGRAGAGIPAAAAMSRPPTGPTRPIEPKRAEPPCTSKAGRAPRVRPKRAGPACAIMAVAAVRGIRCHRTGTAAWQGVVSAPVATRAHRLEATPTWRRNRVALLPGSGRNRSHPCRSPWAICRSVRSAPSASDAWLFLDLALLGMLRGLISLAEGCGGGLALRHDRLRSGVTFEGAPPVRDRPWRRPVARRRARAWARRLSPVSPPSGISASGVVDLAEVAPPRRKRFDRPRRCHLADHRNCA